MTASEFVIDLTDAAPIARPVADPVRDFLLLEDETDAGGYPIVEAVRTKSGAQLVFACRYCGCDHLHGAGERFGDGDGHRVAHCIVADSPYQKTGYILREVASLPKPVKRFKPYVAAGSLRSGYLRAKRERLKGGRR